MEKTHSNFTNRNEQKEVTNYLAIVMTTIGEQVTIFINNTVNRHKLKITRYLV